MKTVKHEFRLFAEAEAFQKAIELYGDKQRVKSVDSCFNSLNDTIVVTVVLWENEDA